MKYAICMIATVAAALLLVGCSSTQRNNQESRVLAPASQEVVRGEGRGRAKAHTDLGFEYYAQKQLGVALQEAKVALNQDNSYTPTYNLLALIYMDLGDPKLAEDAFQHALRLSPGDPEIANNYGWFLCQTKREQQSFQYFNTALQNPLYPTPGVALANATDCALRLKDYAAAAGYLTRALVLNPNSVRVLLTGANLKYQQKQYAEARYYISQVHKNAEPTSASAWLSLRIARQMGNREDEARYLSLLRKKFPDSEEYKKLTQGSVE